MPLPWQTEQENPIDEPGLVEVAHSIGRSIDPPKFHRNLDLRGIDTRSYYNDAKRRYAKRDVVASAKEDCSVINQFCEENVVIVDQDSNSPEDYDIENDLEKILSDKRLVKNLRIVKVTELNAVQRKAIKVIREGNGLMVEAPTGIGKTYAFLIPAIERAIIERKNRARKPEKPSPFVLIIANTGTLVRQLHGRCQLILGMHGMDECEEMYDIPTDMLVANHKFIPGLVKNSETVHRLPDLKFELQDECDIAFCTMGKLKSAIESEVISLDDLKMIILDEADKMIDTSAFGMDIEWVLDKLKDDVFQNLQSCFLSATFPRDYEGSIALTPLQMRMFHNSPWKLVHCPSLPGYITQQVIRLDKYDRRSPLTTHYWVTKMNVIRALIDKDLAVTNCTKEGPYVQTIAIFCETIQRVAQVSMALRLLGYNFRPLCRTITKMQQEITLNDLEFRRIHGIVCTNIMSRGIDVSSIKHTIIMEMSTDFDTYKHRIGRVGRDGSGGLATVLIDPDALMGGQRGQIIDQLYVFMSQCGQEVPSWLKDWFEERHPYDPNDY